MSHLHIESALATKALLAAAAGSAVTGAAFDFAPMFEFVLQLGSFGGLIAAAMVWLSKKFDTSHMRAVKMVDSVNKSVHALGGDLSKDIEKVDMKVVDLSNVVGGINLHTTEHIARTEQRLRQLERVK